MVYTLVDSKPHTITQIPIQIGKEKEKKNRGIRQDPKHIERGKRTRLDLEDSNLVQTLTCLEGNIHLKRSSLTGRSRLPDRHRQDLTSFPAFK